MFRTHSTRTAPRRQPEGRTRPDSIPSKDPRAGSRFAPRGPGHSGSGRLKIPEGTEIDHFAGGHEIHSTGTFAFLQKHPQWPK
jgi:hypothetical protein